MTEKPLYFEDLPVGTVYELDGPTLSEESIVEFARKYDPQYFHIDPEAAKSSIYGGLIASGWHTVSLTMRMICDAYLTQAASLGSPGVNEVRWLGSGATMENKSERVFFLRPCRYASARFHWARSDFVRHALRPNENCAL